MKRIFSLMLFWSIMVACFADGGHDSVASDFLAQLPPGAKPALLMVHFGTSYDDTRALTIDAINAKAKAEFPELEVREAYTSRIIVVRLARRGIEKLSPLEALIRLRAEGYTHIIVQSTHLLEGVEMESLRADVASVASLFEEVRIGRPLLYSVDDCDGAVEMLAERHAQYAGKKAHVVWVGHGTYTPVTSIYSQIDYMLKEKGFENYHVGTIEGYPSFDSVVAKLKAAKAKTVTLVPFMFVAGDHARNDIAGEWKEALEEEGFTVNTHIEGLGQVEEIQNLCIEHIRFALKHRDLGIMEKKADYKARGEK